MFGTVFWDYSHIPFNLGGRINLLFCFFWGIAAVVWLKGLYPRLSAWIERIPIRWGKAGTWVLIVFMAVSYTHLDVYKRQAPLGIPPGKRGWRSELSRPG